MLGFLTRDGLFHKQMWKSSFLGPISRNKTLKLKKLCPRFSVGKSGQPILKRAKGINCYCYQVCVWSETSVHTSRGLHAPTWATVKHPTSDGDRRAMYSIDPTQQDSKTHQILIWFGSFSKVKNMAYNLTNIVIHIILPIYRKTFTFSYLQTQSVSARVLGAGGVGLGLRVGLHYIWKNYEGWEY